MSAVLTREALRKQIESFVAGEIAVGALAAWAFDQFYREEEGVVVYEEGYEETIAAVLDDLMWGDNAPFTLDHPTARGLLQRIEQAQPADE